MTDICLAIRRKFFSLLLFENALGTNLFISWSFLWDGNFFLIFLSLFFICTVKIDQSYLLWCTSTQKYSRVGGIINQQSEKPKNKSSFLFLFKSFQNCLFLQKSHREGAPYIEFTENQKQPWPSIKNFSERL